MNLTIETCADALTHAAMNRKAAIQIELSVGLAVFHLHGSSSKEARVMLVDAYAAAGYRCVHINEMDYKTVNRRINATAALFERLPIKKWVGHHSDIDAIRAICEGLEPYELFTIQDVIRYSLPNKSVGSIKVTPDASILSLPTGNNHTGHDTVMQQFRRAADKVNGESTRVATEHLALVIPQGTPRAELIDLAMQLMGMAKENQTELLTA
jgi:hypothetical protein